MFCCRNRNNEDIYVYQIVHGETGYVKVSGFARINGLAYYLHSDYNLLTYKTLPKFAVKINNAELFEIFNRINAEKINSISKCKCKGISKNDYIIRLQEKGKIKDYDFAESIGCELSYPCKLIEDIRYAFEKIPTQIK